MKLKKKQEIIICQVEWWKLYEVSTGHFILLGEGMKDQAVEWIAVIFFHPAGDGEMEEVHYMLCFIHVATWHEEEGGRDEQIA